LQQVSVIGRIYALCDKRAAERACAKMTFASSSA
jgi:hypothetical protein